MLFDGSTFGTPLFVTRTKEFVFFPFMPLFTFEMIFEGYDRGFFVKTFVRWEAAIPGTSGAKRSTSIEYFCVGLPEIFAYR